MTLARKYAQGSVPKIYAQRVRMRHYDTLYACCAVCAEADFIGAHFIVDETEAELNRMYRLEDPRPEGGIT